MTAQTQVFLYNQRQWVVLLTPSQPKYLRYEKVYAKNLTINRGVDNILEFAFIDSNQKPVDISGKDITCRIIDCEGNRILLEKLLSPILPVTGITSLQLTAEEIVGIQFQYCYYSLEIPVNTFNYPVFVDSQGGARGVINIVDSVLPAFKASTNVSIPSHARPLGASTQLSTSSTYYSSIIPHQTSNFTTFQIAMNMFTGSIKLQGSTSADFGTQYDITGQIDFVAASDTYGFSIDGYHPYIRVKIINVGTEPAIYIGNPPNQTSALQGDITEILVR